MFRWIKRKWKLWRMAPGLRAASDLAYDRAWAHPNAKTLGPEMNLINLSNDLNGYRLKLDANLTD